MCSIPQVTATMDVRQLFSPNFPNNYPNNVDCVTTITSPENTVIELEFITFRLEKSESCTNDYLKVGTVISNYTTVNETYESPRAIRSPLQTVLNTLLHFFFFSQSLLDYL